MALNPDVARVSSNGRITGLKPGKTVVKAEKHHEKTHHYGKNQTFSLILRHIFPPVPAAKKRALSVTFATDNTRCQFTTICI